MPLKHACIPIPPPALLATACDKGPSAALSFVGTPCDVPFRYASVGLLVRLPSGPFSQAFDRQVNKCRYPALLFIGHSCSATGGSVGHSSGALANAISCVGDHKDK